MFGSIYTADKIRWIPWLQLNLTFNFEGEILGEEGVRMVSNKKYEAVLFTSKQFIYIDKSEGKFQLFITWFGFKP